MVFVATTHECEAGLDKKLIWERRIVLCCLFSKQYALNIRSAHQHTKAEK